MIIDIKIIYETNQSNILNEGITMCLEIKYYNISVRQHNLITITTL